MDHIGLSVMIAGAVLIGVLGFGPLLGVLAERAAGLCEGYRYWLRAGLYGWLIGQVPLAVAAGFVLATSSALTGPAPDLANMLAASLLTVLPSVAVGIFLAAVIAIRAGRHTDLPLSGELALRERYAIGEIDMDEFERRVERLLARSPLR